MGCAGSPPWDYDRREKREEVSVRGRHIRAVAAALALALSPFLVAPARALDPTRSIDQMYHRAYTHEDGLPPTVSAIAQTPDGYIWVGTASGLFRFDGVRFERIGADRLLSASITAMETSETGDLWIGYQA